MTIRFGVAVVVLLVAQGGWIRPTFQAVDERP
jgi:hypothetical protein